MSYGRISGMVAMVVALALAGIGCGGSDDGSSTAATISKAEFVQTAEKVCVKRSKERDEAGEATNPRNFSGQVDETKMNEIVEEVLNKKIIPSLHSQLEDLEALGTPEEGGESVEKMLQSLAKGIDDVEQGGLEQLLGNEFDAFELESSQYGLNCQVI